MARLAKGLVIALTLGSFGVGEAAATGVFSGPRAQQRQRVGGRPERPAQGQEEAPFRNGGAGRSARRGGFRPQRGGQDEMRQRRRAANGFQGRRRGGNRDDARARWQKMPEKERRRVLEQAREFQNLPEEKREELRRRAEAFQLLLGRAKARLSDEERKELEELPTVQRRRREQELVREIMKEESEEAIKEFAPPGVQRNWNDLPLEDRRRHQREALEQRRRRDVDVFLRELVRKQRLSDEERREILGLDPQPQRRRIFELRQKEDDRFLNKMMKKGLIDRERRNTIRKLKGFARRRALDELRKEDFLEVHRTWLEELPSLPQLLGEPPPIFFRSVKRAYVEHHRKWFRGLPEAERKRLIRMPAARFFLEVKRREGRER